jgi:hypothetical protein
MTALLSGRSRQNSGANRVRLLCIAPYVPHPAMPHAGGAYLHRYLTAASRTEDVTLFAPATDSNAETVRSTELPFSVHLVDPARERFGSLGTRARSGIAALSPGWPVLKAMLASPALASVAARSDVIDVEFGQLLPLVPGLRRDAPAAKLVCTEHDVVAQTFHRRARSKQGLERAALSIQQRRVGKREVTYLNACDLVRVGTAKDEHLLRSMGVTAPILVTDFAGGGPPTRPFELGREGVVAFTGALWRSENASSLLWFTQRVWPLVVARIPGARFLAVGAEPGPEVLALNARAGVTVRSWVPDLDEVYAHAGVFVAPLILGAGVKVKVLDAMRYGLPIVATTIGAEGIVDVAPPGSIAAVTDDPMAFADAVCALLESPDKRYAAGEKASRWIAGRPTFEESVATSLAAYGRLVDRR